MKRPTLLTIVTAIALTLATFALWPARAADEAGPALARGAAVKIYIRGDAAGQALQYVPGISNSANISGTIQSINNDWVVVTQDKREYHIPRGVVLAIEVSR